MMDRTPTPPGNGEQEEKPRPPEHTTFGRGRKTGPVKAFGGHGDNPQFLKAR